MQSLTGSGQSLRRLVQLEEQVQKTEQKHAQDTKDLRRRCQELRAALETLVRNASHEGGQHFVMTLDSGCLHLRIQTAHVLQGSLGTDVVAPTINRLVHDLWRQFQESPEEGLEELQRRLGPFETKTRVKLMFSEKLPNSLVEALPAPDEWRPLAQNWCEATQNLKQARKEIKDHLAELQKELKALKEPFLTSDAVSQADVIPVMLPGRARPCYLHCSKPESAPPKQLRLAQVARVIRKNFGPLKDLLSNSQPEGLAEWTGLLMREMSKTRPRAANLRVLQVENPGT